MNFEKDRYYYITVINSEKMLTISDDSMDNGAFVIQARYHGGSHQQFRFEDDGNGYYSIMAKSSAKTLEIAGASEDDGANVIQNDKDDSDKQKFKFEDAGDGYYHIIAKHSSKALGVPGGSQQEGENIIQCDSQGPDKQQFKVSRAYISKTEVEEILRRDLNFSGDIHFGDSEYFVTPKKDAEDILQSTDVDRYRWTPERFDCDDFSVLLKAEFAKAAYKNKQRRAAYCFGIIWKAAHAFNWMINEDGKVYFIEPQQDGFSLPAGSEGNIYLLIA